MMKSLLRPLALLIGMMSLAACSTASNYSGKTSTGAVQWEEGVMEVRPATLVGTMFFDFADGTSGTFHTAGGITYFEFDNGARGKFRTMDGTTFYKFNDGTRGSFRSFDGTTVYDFSEGTSGRFYTVYGTTFYDYD